MFLVLILVWIIASLGVGYYFSGTNQKIQKRFDFFFFLLVVSAFGIAYCIEDLLRILNLHVSSHFVGVLFFILGEVILIVLGNIIRKFKKISVSKNE